MLENKKSKPLPALRSLDKAILNDALAKSNPHAMETARKAFQKEETELNRKVFEQALEVGYSAWLTGLGKEPAAMAEEVWVAYALTLMNKEGPTLYMRQLLTALRKKLGGTPLLSAANKNEPCPCGSTRRFGRCCGKLIEDGDPDSCRAAGHTYGKWGKVKDGVWVHSCEICAQVETAENVLEIGCEGENVIAVPCPACKAVPTHDDGWKIYTEVKKRSCISCKKPPLIEILTIEHWKDGKHATTWEQGYLKYSDLAWTIGFPGLLSEFLVHTQCLKDHGVLVNEKA